MLTFFVWPLFDSKQQYAFRICWVLCLKVKLSGLGVEVHSYATSYGSFYLDRPILRRCLAAARDPVADPFRVNQASHLCRRSQLVQEGTLQTLFTPAARIRRHLPHPYSSTPKPLGMVNWLSILLRSKNMWQIICNKTDGTRWKGMMNWTN